MPIAQLPQPLPTTLISNVQLSLACEYRSQNFLAIAEGLRYASSGLTGPPTFNIAICTLGFIFCRLCTRFRCDAFTIDNENNIGIGSSQRKLLVTRNDGVSAVCWRMGRAHFAVVYSAMFVVYVNMLAINACRSVKEGTNHEVFHNLFFRKVK